MYRKYYGYTYQPVFYVNLNGTVDFYQEDVQLQQYVFEDEIQKCISCDKQWFLPHTLDSWYTRFREYLANGNCFYAREGIDPFKKTLEPDVFKMCLLWAARNNYFGSEYYKDVYFDQDGNITKYFFSIKTRDIKDPGGLAN